MTSDSGEPGTNEGTSRSSAFTPVKAADYWEVLEPVVTPVVARTVRVSGREERTLYPVATAFVLWAWQTKGMELEARRLFRRSVVEEFVHRGMGDYTRGSRATYRSLLLVMVNAVTPVTDQAFPIPRSEPTPPYTPAEIAELRSWAARQGSASRRRDAWVLLALGCGAGLATRELLSVRVEDVTVDQRNVQVMVWDGRPRMVPVLTAWQAPIRDAFNGSPAPSTQWLFRPGRAGVRSAQVTDFLHRGHTTELDVRPARMRTTWMLTHLEHGTPPRDLLRIAGLEHLAALDRISRFLPARAPRPGRR